MVSVTAFSVLPSNVGILEGGLEPRANASQRDKIVKLAESRYGARVVLVEPAIVPLSAVTRPGRPRERLPWMARMARLSSAPLDPDLVSSELTLVWWQDGFTSPMPAEVERGRRSGMGAGRDRRGPTVNAGRARGRQMVRVTPSS
jgi:hypothetical protein